MKIEFTERGFGVAKFTDRNDVPSSLQESSLATEAAIWLGTQPETYCHFLDESHGSYEIRPLPDNVQIATRMHLTQDMVKALLPHLIKFAETGELS